MLTTDHEAPEREAHEDVCEALREIADAMAGQSPPVVHMTSPAVHVAPAPVQIIPSDKPKTMRFTGTYNGKPVDMTITCTY